MGARPLADYQAHARQLMIAAVAAADPAATVREHLTRDGATFIVGGRPYSLGDGRLYLIGAGKAAAAMGRAAAEIAGDALAAGVLISKGGRSTPIRLGERLSLFEAGHPLPDERGLSATQKVLEIVSCLRAQDLVLCVISGGASALLTDPALKLADWRRLIGHLLASGCTIQELNRVRRGLDRVKNGGLARRIAPAQCATLVLSDVVGNRLADIGSGPTAGEALASEDVMTVLERYGVAEALGPAGWRQALAHLSRLAPVGAESHQPCVIIGDVRRSALGVVAAARRLGYDARLLTSHLQGEAREVGRVVAALAKDVAPGACLVLGGETTVTLRGPVGVGGRNGELALAAAIELEGWPGVFVAAFATDGEDGNGQAAGAVISGETVAAARQKGLLAADYLAGHDSHSFFGQAGGLLGSGATGTNVNDIVIIGKYS
jgi:hydroxypyruvate reductase